MEVGRRLGEVEIWNGAWRKLGWLWKLKLKRLWEAFGWESSGKRGKFETDAPCIMVGGLCGEGSGEAGASSVEAGLG